MAELVLLQDSIKKPDMLCRFFGGGGGGGGPFGNFFGGGGQEEEPEVAKGNDVFVTLEVTLKDLYLGKSFQVGANSLPLPRCPAFGYCVPLIFALVHCVPT